MARPHGLVGGIKNVYLRRLGLIFIAAPLVLIALGPSYARVIWRALGEAFETFIDGVAVTIRYPTALMTLGWAECWSKSWKPE